MPFRLRLLQEVQAARCKQDAWQVWQRAADDVARLKPAEQEKLTEQVTDAIRELPDDEP
jgi:hypothetical protein